MNSTTTPIPEVSAASPWSFKALWDSKWLSPLALGFILVGLFATSRINNCDLGTDLKTGQWMLQNHAFPQKDTFTYTATENDYLDGKALYQLTVFSIYKLFGYPGISLANTLVVLGVFFLLALRMKETGVTPGIVFGILFPIIFILERRFYVRAEIASWLLLSLTLLVLEWRSSGKKNLLYVLPILQFFWLNTEGLFILGWVLMAAYLASTWYHQHRLDKDLFKYMGLSLLADVLNPYGFRLWSLPFTYFSEFNNSTNSDLVSPLRFLSTQNLKIDLNIHVFLYMTFSALLVLLVGFTYRQRKLHEYVLAGIFLLLSCLAYRNIPLFILVCAPLMGVCIKELLAQWDPTGNMPHILQKSLPILLSLWVLLVGLRVLTNAYYASDRRATRFGVGLDEERIPVQAVQFLVQNHLDGRILNDVATGDWLIWQGTQPVFIDGRQQVFGNFFYQQYFESFKAGGLAQLITLYQPQLIAIRYNDTEPWAIQMKFLPGWRLIYADGSYTLYAAEHYAEQVPTFQFFNLLTRDNITLNPLESKDFVEHSEPSVWGHWFEGFYKPQPYPNSLMSMGLLALHYNDFGAAQALFTESLWRAGGAYFEIYFNLGVASLKMQRFDFGRTCLKKALELRPDDPVAQKMLNTMPSF